MQSLMDVTWGTFLPCRWRWLRQSGSTFPMTGSHSGGLQTSCRAMLHSGADTMGMASLTEIVISHSFFLLLHTVLAAILSSFGTLASSNEAFGLEGAFCNGNTYSSSSASLGRCPTPTRFDFPRHAQQRNSGAVYCSQHKKQRTTWSRFTKKT